MCPYYKKCQSWGKRAESKHNMLTARSFKDIEEHYSWARMAVTYPTPFHFKNDTLFSGKSILFMKVHRSEDVKKIIWCNQKLANFNLMPKKCNIFQFPS